MSAKNKYTSEFKKTIVNLYHSGKSYAQIHSEYGVSSSALSKWVKLYSEVKIDDDTVITAQQIKELQKRNAQLEEENLIVLVFSSLIKYVLYCLIWSDNIFILTTPSDSYYITARWILFVCGDINSVVNDFEFYNNTSFFKHKAYHTSFDKSTKETKTLRRIFPQRALGMY